jgi:hypothetical protein
LECSKLKLGLRKVLKILKQPATLECFFFPMGWGRCGVRGVSLGSGEPKPGKQDLGASGQVVALFVLHLAVCTAYVSSVLVSRESM